MPIASGVVVPADAEQAHLLAEQLGTEPGVEISGVGPVGVAVVFESETMDALNKLTGKIKQRADVVDLQIAYCNWEDQA